MRVVITGISGAIGTYLASYLTAKGHWVIGVSRRPEQQRSPGYNPLLPCIGWSEMTATFMADNRIDAVINLAGAPVIQRWSQHHKATIVASRLAAIRHIFEQLRQMQPSRRPRCVVTASSIAVYSHRDCPVDEAIRPEPDPQFFQSLLWHRVESLVAEQQLSGVRTPVARFGVVIGPDNRMQMMLKLARCHLYATPGNGSQMVSWISAHDTARALELLAERADIGGTLNLTAPEAVSAKQLGDSISSAAAGSAHLHIPAPLLRILLGELATTFLTSAAVLPGRLQTIGFDWTHRDLGQSVRTAAQELNLQDSPQKPADRTPEVFPDKRSNRAC